MSERELAKLVREFLKKANIYFIETKEELKGKKVKNPGHPDFVVCINGAFLAIELKSERYKNPHEGLREVQKAKMELIKRNGGFYLVSNNFDEIVNFINFLRKRSP